MKRKYTDTSQSQFGITGNDCMVAFKRSHLNKEEFSLIVKSSGKETYDDGLGILFCRFLFFVLKKVIKEKITFKSAGFADFFISMSSKPFTAKDYRQTAKYKKYDPYATGWMYPHLVFNHAGHLSSKSNEITCVGELYEMINELGNEGYYL